MWCFSQSVSHMLDTLGLPALRAGKVPAAPSHMLRFASQSVDLRWAAAYPKLDPSALLGGR